MYKKLLALTLAVLMATSILTGCALQNQSSAPPAGASVAPSENASSSAPAKEDLKWPEKPIQVIIGASAGGGTDITGRVTNKVMEKYLNGTLVAVNVVGAGASIASRQVKDSKPDGYTVLYINDNLLTNKISGTADFGAEAFKTAGISTISTNTAFITSSKFKTFQDFVNYAKAHPGELKIGVEMGTYQPQLAAVIMKDMGIKFQIVDTGPVNDCIAALAGGHIDMTQGPIGLFTDYIKQGTMVAQGVLAKERDPEEPDIPTMYELGVNFYLPKFFTYLFPIDTPQEIVDKFSKALEQTVADSEFVDGIKAQKFAPCYMAPDKAIEYMENGYKDMQSYQEILDQYEGSK